MSIALGFVLALPSRAHATAPPDHTEPATLAPATVIDEVQPVDATAQPAPANAGASGVQPSSPPQAAPIPPPPSAAIPRYSQTPAYDLSPPVNRNRGLGLTIAGFSTFGVTYIVGVVGSGGFPVAAIPIAGPIYAGSVWLSLNWLIPGVGGIGALLILDGVAQAVGLGIGIAGAVKLGNARRQARLTASPGGVRLQF